MLILASAIIATYVPHHMPDTTGFNGKTVDDIKGYLYMANLYFDNKKMSGGGNVKQGLVPSGTGQITMPLRPRQRRARYNLKGTSDPYTAAGVTLKPDWGRP